MTKKMTGLAAMLAGKTADLDQRVEAAQQARTPIAEQRAVTAPGRLGEFRLEAQRYLDRITELEKQLKQAKDAGGALELPLEQLVLVEGRQRKLTAEQRAELKENLRAHPLITPITVRVLPDGRYEVVSGHNRVDIYRELGRPTIKAWLDDSDADRTEELAFYANLLHPDLPDYEKYQGLSRIMEHDPLVMTEMDLARRTGLRQQEINRLMAFRHLPPDALALLDEKPTALGATSAGDLAKATKAGKGAQVVAALRQLVNGTIATEKEAVQLAQQKPDAPPKPPKPEWKSVNVGRRTYAKVLATGKTLRIDFTDEAQRQAIEDVVLNLLDKMKQ